MTARSIQPSDASGVRIGNRVVAAAEPWLQSVIEPATGEILAEVAGGGDPEAVWAVDAAATALPAWSATPATTRAGILRRVAAELRDAAARTELATLISRETGKRIAEAGAEVDLSAAYFEWFADVVSSRPGAVWNAVPGVRHEVATRPLGVVAVMTPWNFPLSIPARKIAPALAAGCAVLFKPSEIAPLSGLRLAEIVERFAPPGVLCTIVGDAGTVAQRWLGDSRVRGLSFTGSTRVGRMLAGKAAANLTRCVLELGGNAPFVILDDADVDRAAELLAAAKYRNNGQSCIAANRVWVPRALLDDLVSRFNKLSDALVVGDPLLESTTLGALALPTDGDRLATLLSEAEAAGGTVVPSAVELPARGQFARPGICIDPPADSRIVTEEIFGPTCSISGYDSLEEVVTATRESPFGLAGYVVARDIARATDVGRALDVGIVGVNTAAPNTPQIPFAGLKFSGIGTEGGELGLDAFRTDQSIAVAPS